MEVELSEKASDPWYWSVEQLIDFLCKDRTWLTDRPHARHPDPIELEALIRDEAIDGSVFLSDIDRAMLKEVLGIRVAELGTILEAQRILRAKSSHYQSKHSPVPTNKAGPDAQIAPAHSKGSQDSGSVPTTLEQRLTTESSQSVSYVTDQSGHKRRRVMPTTIASLNDPFRSNLFRKSGLQSGISERTQANDVDDEHEDVAGDEDGMSSVDDDSEDEETGDDEFDYLAHWQDQVDDELLPLYGQSDSEDLSDSFIEEIEDEIAEDEEEEQQKSRQLTKDDALRVIGEQVIKFEEAWMTTKKPKRDALAWKIWAECKSGEERQQRTEQLRNHLEYLKARFLTLSEKLISTENSESELRRLCATFQTTIEDQQDTRHRLAIWANSEAPRKPAMRLVKRKKTKRQRRAANADDVSIDLSSEEEFVVDDEPPSPSSPSSPPTALINDLTAPPLQPNSHRTDTLSSKRDVANTITLVSSPPALELSSQVSVEDQLSAFDFKSHDFGIELPHVEVRKLWETQARRLSADPLKDSDFLIRGWSIDMLDHNEDIKRIILKILYMPEEFGIGHLIHYMRQCDSLCGDIYVAMQEFANGVPYDFADEATAAKITALGKLFLCWWYRSSLPMRIDSTTLYNLADTESGALKRLASDPWHQVVRGLEIEVAKRAEELIDFCRRALDERDRRLGETKGTEDVIEISSDDLDDESDTLDPCHRQSPDKGAEADVHDIVQDSVLADSASPEVFELSSVELPRPKIISIRQRKRAVGRDQTAVDRRAHAQIRFEEVQRRTRRTLAQGQFTPGHICINPGKSDDAPFIYINKHLSQKIQQHQIDGVRFMWNQVTETGSDTIPGGLLAHSMGLGKTLQALTLISTIGEAGASPKVRDLIPAKLRSVKALILCPAGLVSNWETEFMTWIPNTTLAYKAVGDLQACRSQELTPLVRTKIHYWHECGGVLLMGFERFRGLVLGTKSKLAISGPKIDEQLRDILIRGPNLVILDEAHKVKNSSTGIRQAVDLIETRVRIAMTGSPLSNNLMEYFDLLDWACPGYLGSRVEFAAYFEEIIQRGNYHESTVDEIRLAQERQKLLEHECAPKVHKRDREVLNQQLKPKVEFIITVPLTGLQKQIYEIYVEYLNSQTTRLSKDGSRASNVSYLGWVGDLTKICNHPVVFTRSDAWTATEQLAKHAPPQSSTNHQSSAVQRPMEDLGGQFDLVTDPAETQARLAMYSKAKQAFNHVANADDPAHSFRISILLSILEESRNLGDQTLVFTHSLKFLDWLRDLLRSRGFRALTIDGRTEIVERVKMVDDFNRGSHPVALLSTKAGALGFNITGANRAVIMDFSHNPQWEIQAASRVWRLGQEKRVFIYRFVSGGTHQDKLLNNAISKTQLAHKVVKDKNPENMAIRDMRYIEPMTDIEQKDVAHYIGSDAILDRILSEQLRGKDRGIRAIRTTDQLEREREVEWTTEQQQAMLEASRKRREEQVRLGQAATAPKSQTVPATATSQPYIIDLSMDSDPVETPTVAGYLAPIANMGAGDVKAAIDSTNHPDPIIEQMRSAGIKRKSEQTPRPAPNTGGPVKATAVTAVSKGTSDSLTASAMPGGYQDGPFRRSTAGSSLSGSDSRPRPRTLRLIFDSNASDAGVKGSNSVHISDEAVVGLNQATASSSIVQRPSSSNVLPRQATGSIHNQGSRAALTAEELARIPTEPKAMRNGQSNSTTERRGHISNSNGNLARGRSRSPLHWAQYRGRRIGLEDQSSYGPTSSRSSSLDQGRNRQELSGREAQGSG